MEGETRLVPYIWDTEYFVRCQFYILQGLRGGKMDKFIPDRKNATIIAFDKPISEKFSHNIRTGNTVSSHPLSLVLKYRFEKFVLKYPS